MPAAASDPHRLRVIGLTETCGNCVRNESALELSRILMIAEIVRLETELDRALGALQRESHVMDAREPHRRRV